jgi:hypothetical protein
VGIKGEDTEKHAVRNDFKGSHNGCFFYYILNPEMPENCLATKVRDAGMARLISPME